MTHREPNQRNPFLDITEAVMLLLLAALPVAVVVYGAWMTVVAIARVFS